MARLSDANLVTAREILSRYPRKKSALIPLLHLAQEQDGYVTEDAMKHLAELVEVTPAQVLGTASFYEMFKFEPVGRYVVNICDTMSCALMGAEKLIEHAETKLGIRSGGTTPDGQITIERAACQAACNLAPTLQVNYRYRYHVSVEELDQLLDDLAAGRLSDEFPDHGTLAQHRQHIPAERAVGPLAPELDSQPQSWMAVNETTEEGAQ
ncbi:MAG: NAD(P)H-dependent oxidoreductase subunit E [Acidimicrobiia bacterium]